MVAVSEGALKQSSVKWSAKAQPSGSSAHKESTSSPRKHANAVGSNGLNEESAGTWQPGSGRSRPSAWRRLVPAIVFGYAFNRQLWKTPETTTETADTHCKNKCYSGHVLMSEFVFCKATKKPKQQIYL